MRRSNRLLAIADTIRDLARNGWVFAACTFLIAVAVSIQARVPRTTYRAIAMLQLAADTTGELPSAGMIHDAIFHRATSDERLAARVMAPKGKTSPGSFIQALQARLMVKDRAAPGLFAVEYVDENPQRAVDLANAFAALAVQEPTPDSIHAEWKNPGGEAITAGSLKSDLEALQQRVDVLRASISVQADGVQSDLRAMSDARHQLQNVKAALAAARSRPAESQSVKGVALLLELDGDLRTLTAQAPANQARIESTRRALEAELLSHVPGRAMAEAGTPGAETPQQLEDLADAKRRAKIARLESKLASKRRRVAALTARIDAARDKQNEFATAVVNLDAARLAYERAVGPSGLAMNAPRAVVVLPAVASVPTARRPVWLPLISTALIIAALVFLVAASWQSYQSQPVLSEADLRAVAPIPVLVSIPEIPYLVPPHARRWPFVTNAVFTALSLALLVVVLFQVIGR